jgi:simple sugar transport system ATP-binding protein
MTTALEVKNITKQFPGVLANDKVNLELKQGEILALLGENGAGKTTLMNVVYGLYKATSGEIYVKGQAHTFHSPNDAIAQGIGMVHQHFMLIPVFTVAENIMLGAEELRNGIVLDRRLVAKKIKELSDKYGLDVDPNAMVADLPVGIQQRVEIVKALYRKAEILILDEPTAVLTPQEANDLFKIMHKLTEQGVSIIFITHKLKEVMAIADRITVMRGGRVVGTANPKEMNEQKLADMMVGREVILTVEKGPANPKEEVLKVDNLHVEDLRGGVDVVHGVTFSVRAGEILGIAGVQGNGQTELVEALTGLRKPKSGKVILGEHDVTGQTPREMIEQGAAHIPEDRQRHGLVLSYPITDNLMLCSYYKPPFSRRGVIQNKFVDDNARKLVKQFDVRTPSAFVACSKLSGGNQQKVIVARELSRPIKFLVCNQPTRGLDVGSIEYIHSQIIANRDQGVAVLLVSAELDEILALSDRVAVMYRGQIVAILDVAEATREKLGLLMAGITH